MLRAILVALVCAVAVPAAAQIVPTPGQTLDLSGLIQQECGNAGFGNNRSCTLDFRKYPKGVYNFSETETIGTCTSSSTIRMGITIIGHGASPPAQVPSYPTSSTTFRWQGVSGGTMLSLCGHQLRLRDIQVEAQGAGVGIEWRANVGVSALSHFGGLERVVIRNDFTGTCLRVLGDTYNDQIDFLAFRDVALLNCMHGFSQDSQQAVNNTFDNVEVVASHSGVRLLNGSIFWQNGYIGQKDPGTGYRSDFSGFYLGKSAATSGNMKRHTMTIRDSHLEIMDGRFIRDVSESTYPLSVENVNFQHLPQTTTMASTLWAIETNAPGDLTLEKISMTSSTPQGVVATPRICRRTGPPALVEQINVAPWMNRLDWSCPN